MSQNLGMIAFTNVHVIPMDRERLLENQTVMVEGDRITAVGPAAEVIIPEEAKVIEGSGAYLMPGLADMHIHIESIRRTFEGPDQLLLYLAEGVTTVRNMSAMPEHLTWAGDIGRGERFGPTLYNGRMIVGLPDEMRSMARTFRAIIVLGPVLIGLIIWLLVWAGMSLSGNRAQFVSLSPFILPTLGLLSLLGIVAVWLKIIPLNVYTSRLFPFAMIAETSAEARRYVRQIMKEGYDFVKLYDWLPADAYLSAADEARKRHFYAIGHLLDELSLRAIFEGGLREAAHMDEFIDSHMIGKASPQTGFNEIAFDYETIPQSAALAKAYDILAISNMVADETIYKLLEDPAGGLAQPKYAIVPAPVLEAWQTSGRLVNWQAQTDWRRHTLQPFLMAMTKSLYDAGVPLLIGTDMTVEGMIPAHIHRDLELLVEAGLSPFAALEAGTKNAGISAQRMGQDGDFGTVAVGQRADLILLEENPLEDVSHSRRRLGVMARGRWFTQSELDALVNDYVTSPRAKG